TNATAKEVANFLYEEIICQHGVPSSIISDREKAFLGRVVGLLKEEVGFKHKLAASYHPQTNGLIKRFNKTLCRSFGKCFSPFYLLHGKEAQLPLHLELPKEELVEVSYEEVLNRRIAQIVGTFTDALILVKDNIGTAQQVQEEHSKRIEKVSTFKEGDLVILYDAAKQNVYGDKFTQRWTGPYYIHRKISDKTVILRDKADPDKLSLPINTSLIKHYKQRD
ncbi:738_t:CDS:2, partial [Diversispora eburnea]